MPVRAAAFVGHPVGPQVTLFEDMHGDAAAASQRHGLGMDRPRVAVKHKIGDAVLRHEPGAGLGPPVVAVPEGDVARAGPEDPVAQVEAHAPDLGPRLAQQLAQPVKPGAVRTLQKKKAARRSAHGMSSGLAWSLRQGLAEND